MFFLHNTNLISSIGRSHLYFVLFIYYHQDAFTLGDAENMVEDQIRMDKEAGREPLAYDPQFFYDTIVELMEQDAE